MVSFVTLLMVAVFGAVGYRRGATRIVGSLLGVLVALLIAPLFGRAIEGLAGVVLGTGGILNRLIAIGFAGVLVAGAAGYLFSIGAKKLAAVWLADQSRWRRADRFVGLGLGAGEGLLVMLAVMWAVIALEPVAASRLAADRTEGREPHAVAARVRKFAGAVQSSTLGRLAQASMPGFGADLAALAADFAAISRDREALEFFTSTPVMKRINALPSVRSAQNAIDADPVLRGTFSEKGIDAGSIGRILESDTLLRVLDQTTIASDFKPLVPELKAAIGAAKAKVRAPAAGPESR